MRSVLLLSVFWFAVPHFAAAEDAKSTTAPPRPNVLFLAIDDLNDWVGCLGGHPQAKTPHIDRLAARGVLFASAHCQAPLCNPSRTSLLTGLRPGTTGVYGLAPWFRNVPRLADRVTLPQNFARAGYRTFSTGKIYHGGYGRGKDDEEFHALGPAASVGAKPANKLVDTPSPHPLVDWGTFPHQDEDKGDWQVASWAVEQLQQLGKQHGSRSPGAEPPQPFFLSAGFFLPHVPCYATGQWFDLYPTGSLLLPPIQPDDRADTPRFSWYLHWQLPEPRLHFLQESSQWKNLVRSYLASISFVDSQVGRVLTALEAASLQDNTLVVLWSDHGFHLGEKEITGKNTLWEESTRVPLMFAGPGIPAGNVCETPVELLDIYPTLNTLCRLPAVDGLEGQSLVPQLNDPSAPRERPAVTTHNAGNHSIRTRHWRLIRYADGTSELYDLKHDPEEWTNLASRPEHAATLKKLARWLPTEDAAPAPGSRHRILTFNNGQPVWEGKAIGADDPIPEVP